MKDAELRHALDICAMDERNHTAPLDMRVDWDLLLPYEKLVLANGCGPGKYEWLVPEFIFGKSCLRHDVDYFIGKDDKDRKKADRRFLGGNLKAVCQSEVGIHLTFFYFCMAWVYYFAVRWGGGKGGFLGKPPFRYREHYAVWGDFYEEVRRQRSEFENV